ncbi:unnamed protein product [Adineta steineri]|uniref:NAD(P)(+)--arginine ADP-ribosyltransferase n=1 Tax=Adineta steineri TaxID=433720 RepID=A0A814RFC7_9BILA|nr:unnamed protein product [Adineta steineri]CAF4063752.1 unnamed protein product [Adineta steineri]
MLKQRIEDVLYETNRVLLPIEGYQNEPLVSLEEAVVPLFTIFDKKILEKNVWIAKKRCESPSDGLTHDESASIMLYTFQWNIAENSPYFILNQTLRMENRQKLKPWFLYLKLFITALCRLPSINGTFCRGVNANLTDRYTPNSNSIWWGVSSCTSNIYVLQTEQFCGKTGPRTLFMIKCHNARSIKNHSYYATENETILLPGSYFQVVGQLPSSDGLTIIQLEEKKPPHDLFPLPIINQWRRMEPGMCLEGMCVKANCVGYHQQIVCSISFQKLNLLTDTKPPLVKCPICSGYVKILKIGFNHCLWRWHGTKQISPNEKPIFCKGDWCQVDTYSIFEHDIQGTTSWTELIIETKPKS